jgi:hypothetical protein
LTTVATARTNLGLGTLATKSSIVDADISGTIANTKIAGLGTLALKSTITNTDVSASAGIVVSKLSGLGGLATLNNVGDTLITGVSAGKVSGVLATAQIPNLDAGKITSGTFTTGLIPNLDAGKITTGVFATTRIPSGVVAGKVQNSTHPGWELINGGSYNIPLNATTNIPFQAQNYLQGATFTNSTTIAVAVQGIYSISVGFVLSAPQSNPNSQSHFEIAAELFNTTTNTVLDSYRFKTLTGFVIDTGHLGGPIRLNANDNIVFRFNTNQGGTSAFFQLIGQARFRGALIAQTA